MNVTQRNNRITFNSTMISDEELINLDLNFKDNSKVKITKENHYKHFINNLPNTLDCELFAINMNNLNDKKISFELICTQNEYYIAIEKEYLILWNLLLKKEEDSSLEKINESDALDLKLKFLSTLTPKIQILSHSPYKEESFRALITNKHINSTLSYTKKDYDIYKEIIAYLPEKNLRSLLSDNNEKVFYIVKGTFENNHSIEHKESLIESPLNFDQKNKNIAIIVHGLGSSCINVNNQNNFEDLTQIIVDNFHTFTFDYITINQHIDTNAKLLADKINELKTLYPQKKVIIIAHSMGGLVSRAALINCSAAIDKIIMAGTPNNGSEIKNMNKLVGKVLLKLNKKNIKNEDVVDIFRGNYNGLLDLGRKTTFITELNKKDSGNDNKYYSIIGDFLNSRTDALVTVRNMMKINNRAVLNYHKGNWIHTEYFSRKNLNNSVVKALEKINM